MAHRIALVTPFSWSQPHDVNEHAAGLARELRERGHRVTVLAPSNRARELPAGRRSLVDGLDADVVAAAAAAVRFPGRYELVPTGVDLEQHAPGDKHKVVVLEWRQLERPLLRALAGELRALPEWELIVLRTRPLSGRPTVPRALRGRAHVRAGFDGGTRAGIFRGAAVFVPALEGVPRAVVQAQAAGVAIAAPPGRELQPELAAAEMARLLEDDAFRSRRSEDAEAAAAGASFAALADRVEEVYGSITGRRRAQPPRAAAASDPDWIVADLHLHTSWSHDCSIEVDDLLDHAEAEGLGAIAVTDHNVFGGALEAAERARGRRIVVVPGEEVKTAGQGEVIGLFLREEIPRGLSFAETVAAIRAQGGLVYVPHPFDRLHAIPDPATLHRHLAEIDVLEVYNARLLFETYNDEAVRFARKYNLTVGAGSDAHVLQGVGTGAVRMRRFDGPEEFLVSLRSAEVLRRPKSLAYLQGLK